MKRIAIYSVIVTMFALGFSTVAVVGYWLLAPYDLIQADTEDIGIYTENVVQGRTLEYGRHWCMQSDGYVGHVTREFIDGVKYVTPTVTNYYQKGCRDTRVVLEVPMIPPGTYRLHSVVEYQVNPLRTKHYEFWTQPFEVHPRPPFHAAPVAAMTPTGPTFQHGLRFDK